MRGEVVTPRSWVIALPAALTAAFLSAGVSACLQSETQRKDELRERAEEILPPGARLLVIGYGDCVELAASPSCAEVVFEMAEPDSGTRAALLRDEAERHGWKITHSDDAPGGWSVFASRGDFTAVAFLWRPEAYGVDCRGQPNPKSDDDRFCFNTLNVQS
jgi:hypothetical protein